MMSKNIFWLYCLSSIVYFGQGIENLPMSGIFFYLKETLHFDEQKIMYLTSLISVAWLIKPVIGYMVDKTLLTKKFWISLSIITSALICAYIGLIPGFSLPIIVGLMMLSSWNGAVRDVTVDGIMCVEGKAASLTGKIQSIQWMSMTVALILVGVGGGYLAEHYSYHISYLLLIPFYLIMLGIALQYKPSATTVVQNKESFWSILKSLFTDKELMLVCLFIFLYNFAPSIGTPLTFIERDQWHWSKLWIGTLGTISAVASVIGCILYWKFSKKIDINKWLMYSVWIGAFNTLCYMYFTPVTCVVYDVVDSVIGMFLQLVVLDYMARKSKPGMESMSFALLCSVTNLASTVNGFTGGFLVPLVNLKVLILISAASSFLCLPLIKRIKV